LIAPFGSIAAVIIYPQILIASEFARLFQRTLKTSGNFAEVAWIWPIFCWRGSRLVFFLANPMEKPLAQGKGRPSDKSILKGLKMTNLKDQRQRWRKYNKSTEGKARYRRWRQSPHGKAKLQEKYRERKAFLDGVKAEAGCRVCGEGDPRILSFVPRDPRRVKFFPVLANITRSLEEWREVIRGSGVFCGNCLAKKSRGGESVTASEIPGSPYSRAAFKSLTINSGASGYHPTCKVCKAKLGPKNVGKGRRREFCSDRCRLLFWAARKLLDAVRAGHAPGLSEIFRELRTKT
jgi:hypothetical protein